MSLLNVLFRRVRINQASRYILDGSVICDIGCGVNAEFLRFVDGKIMKGIGIDSRIEDAKFRNIELIKFDLEKSDKLELSDDQFDHVLLLATLEHVRCPEKILKEAYRILKLNGSLIATSPAPQSEKIIKLLLSTPFFDDSEEASKHKSYFSGKALKGMVLNAGFVEVFLKKFELGFNSIVVGYKRNKA
jgi:ubiquinone/menaquinone biosynthesis C-methylase UbiE